MKLICWRNNDKGSVTEIWIKPVCGVDLFVLLMKILMIRSGIGEFYNIQSAFADIMWLQLLC